MYNDETYNPSVYDDTPTLLEAFEDLKKEFDTEDARLDAVEGDVANLNQQINKTFKLPLSASPWTRIPAVKNGDQTMLRIDEETLKINNDLLSGFGLKQYAIIDVYQDQQYFNLQRPQDGGTLFIIIIDVVGEKNVIFMPISDYAYSTKFEYDGGDSWLFYNAPVGECELMNTQVNDEGMTLYFYIL